MRVVGSQLDKRTVDDKDDPVDGDGGLCDVGGHHNLVRSNRSGQVTSAVMTFAILTNQSPAREMLDSNRK